MVFNKKNNFFFSFKKSFYFFIAFFLLFSHPLSAKTRLLQSKTPTPVHLRLECKFIATISQRYLRHHINFYREDEKLEGRVIDQLIKKMDPMKRNFTQKDVKTIKANMKGILKKIKKQDCGSIKKAYALYKKRFNERVLFAKKILNSKFNLNREEGLILDPSFRSYPKGIQEINDYYKKYIQFQVASSMAGGEKTEKEAKQHVLRSYERHLKSMKKTTDSELWAMFLDSYSSALDPHSGYLSVDDLEEFEIRMSLSLEGIGANLSYRDGFTVVEELVPGGAASRSGLLKIKDKIIAVAQDKDGKFENVIEMPLRDVVKKIRGPKGTTVRLTILRKKGIHAYQKGEGGVQRFNISLVRDEIKLEEEAISYDLINKKTESKKNRKIVLVRLDSFYSDPRKGGRSAFSDFKKILLDLRKKKVDALVLDLSFNRGGTLEDAVNIVGLFIKTGSVVKQSQRFPAPDILLADKDSSIYYSGPMVVLVDRVSASASEIVAGALQDYKRAIVVGADHTFGKGSVQSVEILPKGFGAIKTTVGMYFIPSGKSTQRIGIASDVVLPSVFSEDAGEKTLDYALETQKIQPFISKNAYVKKGKLAWNKISQSLIQRLKKKSKERVQKSEDFQKIVKNIEKSKRKGKIIKISDLFSDDKEKNSSKTKIKGKQKEEKKKKETSSKIESAKGRGNEGIQLSKKEEKKKAYFERADINEALNVALDLVEEFYPDLQMAVQSVKN